MLANGSQPVLSLAKSWLWDQLFAIVQQNGEAEGELAWQVHYVEVRLFGRSNTPRERPTAGLKLKLSVAARVVSAPKFI